MADDLLRNGQPVPDFSLRDTDGNAFAFGQRPAGTTILAFIRGEWCPVCNAYLEGLKAQLSAFAAENAHWVVVGDEQVERLQEMKRRIGLDVPFLVDTNGTVGRSYGLKYTPEEHGGHLEPGVFVVGPNGALVAGSYATGPHGRMAVEDALRLVKMMNANAAKAAAGAAGDTAAGQGSPEALRAAAQTTAQRSAAALAVAEASLGVQRSEPRTNVLLDVQDLKMHFPVTSGVIIQRKVADVKAVDGISFDIKEGETLGLVGESGCGKSTTGRAILQLHRPTAGHVFMYDTQAAIASDAPVVKAQTVDDEQGTGIDLTTLKGRTLRLYRRRMQMIFQDPYASLNPRMSVGSIVGEPMAIHGLHKGKGRRKERVRELLNVVGLNPFFASRYPHEFSGGQRQRIGIARALAVEPAFIVADEPVSALDVSIQAQIINLMEELQKDFGLTYLFIAHDLSVVRHISHRIAVMYLGKIVELSDSDRLYENPLHPYTQALLSAVPIPDPTVERERERIILTGDVPSPLRPPPGCNFHTRCPIAIDVCREEDPEWREIEPAHFAKCHRI